MVGSVSTRTHEAAQKVAEQAKIPNGTEIPEGHNSLNFGVDSGVNSGEFSHEIVPVPESAKEKSADIQRSNSTRSLAECISVAEDEEWSALEGVTRVNSLLSIPRFFSGDKKSASWKNWL
ncbi:hypothetical protein QQ045_026962 [Rhodiola kirilowii]